MFVSMKKNEVLECLKTRRSIRAFEPDKMPSKELVAKVVEAGTFAPTGMGKQSPVIVAVLGKKVRGPLCIMKGGGGACAPRSVLCVPGGWGGGGGRGPRA